MILHTSIPLTTRRYLLALGCLSAFALAGCDDSKPVDPSVEGKAHAPLSAASLSAPDASEAMAALYPGGPPKGRKLSPFGVRELPGDDPSRQVAFIVAEETEPVQGSQLDVGAVVFARQGNGWRVESKHPHIGKIGDARMNEDPVDIARIEIGPGRIAFLLPSGGYNQGISEQGVNVFAYEQGRFLDLGIVFTGANNEGACIESDDSETASAAPCWEYTGEILPQKGANPDYFDLEVKRQGEYAVNGAIVPVSDVTCRFDGKSYACPED
ncbi:MAG: hypothetical protein PHE55_10965 [Methylococcaceae bacterium]|nr:hypothetical protein [Methylococcaceae bacterium]